MMKPYYYGNPESGTVLIQMADDHDLSGIEQEVSHIRRLAGTGDFLRAKNLRRLLVLTSFFGFTTQE